MSKRWTQKEDQFLFAYGEDMAGFVAEHDLGRPAASGRARWRKLRDAGALDFMSLAQTAGLAHYLAMGGSHDWDEDALRKVEWMMANAEAICAAMEAGIDLRKVEVSA